MNQRMTRTAIASGRDADVLLFMIEAQSPPTEKDQQVIQPLRGSRGVPFLVINKIDLVRKESLLPVIDQYRRLHPFEKIIPISAATGEGVDIPRDQDPEDGDRSQQPIRPGDWPRIAQQYLPQPCGCRHILFHDGRAAELQQAQAEEGAEESGEEAGQAVVARGDQRLGARIHCWLRPPFRLRNPRSHSSRDFPCRSFSLQLQFQQPNFQGQGFLDIRAQPALKLFHDTQVIRRRPQRNPLRYLPAARQLREGQ